MVNIGYVGLGDMGGPLATRLVANHALHVFDLNPAAVASLEEAGAMPADSLTSLAETCSIVLLCLPTSAHVRAVVLGEGGLADALAPGSLIIDQTSGDPTVTRDLASDLAQRKIGLVDAPVSGGAPAALAGTISIMLGAADDHLIQAVEVLELISSTVTHLGPVGAGHTMKLVNNLLSCSQRLLSLEAIALATKNGVDPTIAVDVLSKGGGRNAYLELQGHKILAGDRDRGFSLGLAHKDLVLACELASKVGVPTFYGSLSRDLYQTAISTLDRSSHVENIAAFVESIADVSLVSTNER